MLSEGCLNLSAKALYSCTSASVLVRPGLDDLLPALALDCYVVEGALRDLGAIALLPWSVKDRHV